MLEEINERLARIEGLLDHLARKQKPQSEIMNINEACELLGVKKSTMHTYMSQRKIPFYRDGGRAYFDRQKLEKHIKKHKFEAI